MKTAVRLPIAIIFSETEILRQGGGMPKRWAQPRSTVSLLEKPTLRRLAAEKDEYSGTVKGNSGDSCRQNQYPVGHYEILGYGVPAY